MNKTEKQFLRDIKDAVSDWDYSYEYYHVNQYGDRYFQVDVDIDDEDADFDDVWDALEEVSNDWGVGLDQDFNTFSLALNVSN